MEKLLSGVKRNIYGNIVGAKAATMLWVLHKKIEVGLKTSIFSSSEHVNMGLVARNSEFDQEIPQSQTTDKHMAPQGRATQQS